MSAREAYQKKVQNSPSATGFYQEMDDTVAVSYLFGVNQTIDFPCHVSTKKVMLTKKAPKVMHTEFNFLCTSAGRFFSCSSLLGY